MNNLIRDLHVFADGKEVGQSCRMRLMAEEHLSLWPQLFHLSIENLSDSSVTRICAVRVLEVRSGDSILAFGSPLSFFSQILLGRQIFSVIFWNSTAIRK